MHDTDREASVLGTLLVDPARLVEISDVLFDVDFYFEKNRKIYGRIVGFATAGRAVDILSLAAAFRDDGELDDIGGLVYLSSLIDNPGTGRGFKDHATAIADYAKRRRVRGEMIDRAESILDPEVDPRAAAEAVLAVSAPRINSADTTPISTAVEQAFKTIEAELDGKIEPSIPCPWPLLTAPPNRIGYGHLVYIGGRPGTGKTSMAVQWATHIASTVHPKLGGHWVDYYSAEMTAEDLARKQVGQISRICATDLEAISDNWNRFTAAGDRAHGLPMHFIERWGLTIEMVVDGARRRFRELGKHIVFIDHMHKMAKSNPRFSEQDHLNHMSGAAKALTLETGCCVIFLCQLNRKLEERPDKRPTEADFRMSGAIEQDGDVLLGLYREGKYALIKAQADGVKVDGKLITSESQLPDDDRTLAEIGKIKMRRGVLGRVICRWEGAIQTYDNVARAHEDG